MYPESGLVGYNSKGSLTILVFNISSMPENVEEIISIIVAPLQFHFDFICLSETKLSTDIEDLYEMQNTNRYHINASRPKGRLAIFVKDTKKAVIIRLDTKRRRQGSSFVEIQESEEEKEEENSIVRITYRRLKTDIRLFLDNLINISDIASAKRRERQ